MKPILLNTEMVQAILDGRKTMTRRIIKPQPQSPVVNYLGTWQETQPCANGIRVFPPPYKPGDILYVRETWAKCPDLFGDFPQYIYRANYSEEQLSLEETSEETLSDFPACVRWKPSIHMPKEAARIFLRVKSVRVERLQAITNEEAIKEGVPDEWPMDAVYCPICKGEGLVGDIHPGTLGYRHVDCPYCSKATQRFENLWDNTIKTGDIGTYGWEANPWVWVIEFERCEKPEEVSGC